MIRQCESQGLYFVGTLKDENSYFLYVNYFMYVNSSIGPIILQWRERSGSYEGRLPNNMSVSLSLADAENHVKDSYETKEAEPSPDEAN